MGEAVCGLSRRNCCLCFNLFSCRESSCTAEVATGERATGKSAIAFHWLCTTSDGVSTECSEHRHFFHTGAHLFQLIHFAERCFQVLVSHLGLIKM